MTKQIYFIMKKFKDFLNINAICFFSTVAIIFSGCVSNKKYQALQTQQEDLQQQLNQCQQRSGNLESRNSALEGEIESLQSLRSENRNLEDQLASAKSSISNLNQQIKNCPEAMTDGVVFKVQIGAYQQRDIPEELDQSVNLDVEEEGEMDKVVVGQFREYLVADKLKKQLRAMGVEEAWIVPYKDGNRVKLEQVLNQVEANTDQ